MSENKDNHGFSVVVAQEIGVNRAIMLQHFKHLQIAFLDKEKSAKEVWVKRSRRALSETYPYFTEKEIRGCLDRLERDEFIRSKVDNTLNYDRTKSYQLDKKGWDLMGDPASDKRANRKEKASDKRANGFDKRANDNVTKGPMNIGSCSSFVDSIVTTKGKLDVAVFDPSVNALIVDSIPVEEKEKTPPDSAPPPNKEKESPAESSPRRYDAFDIDVAAAELKGNEFSAENFARITGTPRAQMVERFAVEVDVFVLEQKGKKTVYNRFDEFSGHFFNYERAKVRSGRNNAPGNQAQVRGIGTQQPQSTLPKFLQNQIGK